MRKAKRGKNRGIKILIALLIAAGVVTAAAFIGFKVFVLKKIDVVGNEIYSDEQIENWVLSKKYSWNTLYVVFNNRSKNQEEIPFVESMEVKLVSPEEIEVEVTEKGVLGYLYIESLGQNAYFDQDGFVVELSNDRIEGVAEISGLDVETAVLYEKLDLGGGSVLKSLLSLTQLLKKYDLIPETIEIENNRFFLNYGSIRVNLGTGTSLNEKILRLEQILPQLEGKSGTLHLDTWNETSTAIYFTPAVRMLPEESETDEDEYYYDSDEDEYYYYSDEETSDDEVYYYYEDDYDDYDDYDDSWDDWYDDEWEDEYYDDDWYDDWDYTGEDDYDDA